MSMNILTIVDRHKIAKAVSGGVFKLTGISPAQSYYLATDTGEMWEPEYEAWQWRMLVEWIAEQIVKPINDGDQLYTSMKLYELAEAIASHNANSLEQLAFELLERQ